MTQKHRKTVRVIFSIILLCLFFVLIELGSYFGYWIIQGKRFSFSKSSSQREQIMESFPDVGLESADLDAVKKKRIEKWGRSVEVLHPYIGYVVDFQDADCPDIGFCDDRIRKYTKDFGKQGFVKKTEDNIIIAITGGSFAYGMVNNSTPGLIEKELNKLPQFKDKQIFIYTLAFGGMKQPQQLMALNFYLSMDAYFDIVINIDGFNEIVLPTLENIRHGAHPFFPRSWHQRVRRGVADRKLKALQGRFEYLRESRYNWADYFQKSFFRYSLSGNLIWFIRDRQFQSEISKVEMETLNYDGSGKTLTNAEVAGPPFLFKNGAHILEQLARFWSRASQMLAAVVEGNGARYYHFLQPNQYVENSKPMSKEERARAIMNSHPYASLAKPGYPFLIEEGKRLKSSGMPFYDLTMVFKDNKEMLYRDGVCHLNQKGYDYIIQRIVTIIGDSYVH